ncbi:ATP-dependent protease LonB [Limnochorda pilosa]|uniref:endopeptidase La n=1 Tax=Limnochorda pilosa TaxID=1555112 RepID=A0A0K2SJ87_LIMPI|nr:ATP-dependent protease LonB [Limnochorda pilosa]BAS27181.1 Lon protease [Limnochorda pilosa]
MEWISLLSLVNLFFGVVIGLYFWNLLRAQQVNRGAIERESRRELEKLQRMRSISLTEPLAEKTRPARFEEIIGQEDALTSLRAALCGPNPQHVLLFGPPGVGKTAAARLVLEEAKRNPRSPFKAAARFVEIDATTARFDDRGIADPLMGSVHDPIYQGAGPMGIAGIPQPKPGAVTKAHGGVLFIDEIGELHPIQMNKLLKVLEDRKVFLESAYYSSEDPNIPSHVHDVFQHGLPADFRLVGATTRMPHEIPPAIRSRCVEIFFRALTPDEVALIARNAAVRIRFQIEEGALEVVRSYATNGRDAVNLVQITAGVAEMEGRTVIRRADVEWAVNAGQHSPRPQVRVAASPQVGVVNGLAVYGPNMGTLLEVEAVAASARAGKGRLTITGVMEEEEMGAVGMTLRRRSQARSSVDNVLTALRTHLGLRPQDYDIHVNFPGGVPVDGPSAGVAMVTAIYSAMTGEPVRPGVAMTGEVSVRGLVRPVGGLVAKVVAARLAGVRRVIIPRENWQAILQAEAGEEVDIRPVDRIEEVLDLALLNRSDTAVSVPESRGVAEAVQPAAAEPARREHRPEPPAPDLRPPAASVSG